MHGALDMLSRTVHTTPMPATNSPTPSSRATILYRTSASTPDEAINIADNWLSMFLDWQGTNRPGEDYRIYSAIATPDGTDEETGETIYAVHVPIVYTDNTNPTLLGFIVADET